MKCASAILAGLVLTACGAGSSPATSLPATPSPTRNLQTDYIALIDAELPALRAEYEAAGTLCQAAPLSDSCVQGMTSARQSTQSFLDGLKGLAVAPNLTKGSADLTVAVSDLIVALSEGIKGGQTISLSLMDKFQVDLARDVQLLNVAITELGNERT